MRLTSIFLIVASFHVAAKGKSQTVTLSVKNIPVQRVLQEIMTQSGVSIVYDESIFSGENRISLDVKNATPSVVIGKCLEGLPFNFKQEANTIIIKKIPPPMSLKEIIAESPPPITVTGKVLDETGDPVEGATVSIKGTKSGSSTDIEGRFSILADPKDILQISSVGYVTVEVAIKNQTSINVNLLKAENKMDEVVVVGYGTQKKVNLTGALSTVSSEQLENRPISSAGQGLQGLVPNLNITFRNGNPAKGGGVDFNIRGYESINGGAPLIIIDGVPMDIELINPNDIESITVLKDAAASAIYGARASFGVVLVTTKTGAKTKGAVSVQYNYEGSLSKPIMSFDMVDDSYTMAVWKNKSSVRATGTALYDDRFLAAVQAFHENPTSSPEWAIYDGSLEFYGYNNWKDKLVRGYAPTQKHNVVVSGSSKNANYYVSFGTLNKDGFLKVGNDNFQRYNILMKASFRIKEWLTLDEKIGINLNKTNGPNGYYGDFNSVIVRPIPLIPWRFPKLPGYEDLEGMDLWINTNVLGLNTPYAQLDRGGREKTDNTDVLLTTGVTLNPVKNLIFRGEYSKNVSFLESEAVTNSITYANTGLTASEKVILDPLPANSTIAGSINRTNYTVLNIYGEYSLTLGKHYVKGMAGFNREFYYQKNLGANSTGLISPQLSDLNLTNGVQRAIGGRSELALGGAYYRLNYIFNNKYLFEANGRYDGTSRFPKADRFGFFPSFSAGWRIGQENFMKFAKPLFDDIKIRASYGSLGNQTVGSYYPYIASMGVGLSSFLFNSNGQAPMVIQPGLVSSTLTWEKVISKNLGLDLVLLKNRLDASFDIYTRETNDMLMNAVYPSILGAAAPKINGADLRTKGWEFAVTYRGSASKDFTYNATFTLADNQTEITKYNNVTGTLTDYYVGQKIGQIWGYETVGIFQTEEEITKSASQSQLGNNWRPGDIHYADLNGDDVINPGKNTIDDHGDLKIIGNSTPRYSYGLNLNIHFKNWSLNTFFQGLGKRDYWPSPSGNGIFWPFAANTSFENWMINESWSEDNRNAYFYAPDREAGRNQATQTRFLQDASYIRLKNLTIGYLIPAQLLTRIGVQKINIYFAGLNLWESSKIHRPFDPEMTSVTALEYPFQRSFSVGINLSFK